MHSIEAHLRGDILEVCHEEIELLQRLVHHLKGFCRIIPCYALSLDIANHVGVHMDLRCIPVLLLLLATWCRQFFMFL